MEEIQVSVQGSEAEKVSVSEIQKQIEELMTQQWMLREEFKAYCALHNGHIEERIIDFAAPDWLLQEHLNRYRFASAYVANRNVLDMACGTGYGSHYLYKSGSAASVLGADIDTVAVRYANLRYAQEGLSYRVVNACTKWTDTTFDTVVSFETIEHVPEPEAMLKNVAMMLNDTGTFVVSTPIRQQGSLDTKPLNPHHIREWSLVEFTRLLLEYFQEVEVYGQFFVQRKRVGIVPLPNKVVRILTKLMGKEAALADARLKVMRFDERLTFFTKPIPVFMVCVCKHPKKQLGSK